jgi:uncharacterized protein YkwD
MATFMRRALAIALTAGLLLASVPPVAATTITALPDAETAMIGQLNSQRAALGLVPLRLDARLTTIARARSNDMAAKDYFAHQQPDGLWAWDLLKAAGITYYGAGEIIGRTGGVTLDGSISLVASQWKASASHYALITSTSFNYFGVGVAINSTGRTIWTTIFIKGPDRTGPKAWLTTTSNVLDTSVSSFTSSAKRGVTLRWSGGDVKLQTLTAGIYNYRVQYRLAGTTTWATLVSATTATYATRYLYVGRIYELRIQGKDRAGNYGAWSAVLRFRF